MPDEDPAQQCHRKRLDGPVDKQRDANAAPVLLDLGQRAEVHPQQHRDDHHPDQQSDRQIDLGYLHAANRLDRAGQPLPERDADDDAQEHPDAEVALKNAQGRATGDEAAGRGAVVIGSRSVAADLSQRR